MGNIYMAYLVDSRSIRGSADGKLHWTHRILAVRAFSNKENIKKWARKIGLSEIGARVYIYKNNSNTLYETYRVSHGKISNKGFAFSIFENNRPTDILR